MKQIVSLGKSMGLEVDEGDVNNLVEHLEELTTGELVELLKEQISKVIQEIVTPLTEPEVVEVISMNEIKELLAVWEKFTDFVERKHPENVATGHVIALVNNTCLMHFRNILKGRKKQISLDRFMLKWPSDKSEESIPKKSKFSDNKN